MDEAFPIRRVLGRVLIAAVTVAALTAISALLTGSFDDMDWRVIGTSASFAVYSALAASGAAVHSLARALGATTAATAGLAFVLAVALLWEATDSEAATRTWGVATIAALTLSHWAVVMRARRAGDPPSVRTLGSASIGLSALDGGVGALLAAGVLEVEVSDAGARLLAAALVLLIATTLLTPIVRRVTAATAAARPRESPPSLEAFPRAVIEATERIERLGVSQDVRDECRRLRDAARALGG